MPNLKGSIENLRRQLRSLRFNYEVNFQGMVLGQSSAFVEFYRHLLCDYNTNVTSYLVERGFGILGTTDNRFMEVLYRVLRDVFSFRPSITIAQFFMSGFAERKIEMATTVALNIESLIKRQEKNRIHSNQQQQQHGRYRHHSNHLKTNPSNLTYPQMPLVLPVVSLHHPIERNVEKSPVSCDSKLCTKIGLSNENDSFFCNDLSNGIDYISINDNKSVPGRECSQESRDCCSNRTNCKEAKFDKTTVSYADLNSHNQYEKLSKSDYNQHKCANHSSHLVNNNNPRRPYTSNTVYENCTKLSDYKLPTNTMSKSFNKMNRHSTVQIKSLDDLSDQKQHSKDNYYTSSSLHNKNINQNLLFSGNVPSINQNNHSKLINHDDIQSIMNSLLQLTGKVNGMLTRMNKLESRLANVETDFSFNYHNAVSLLHNHMDATDNFGAKNIIKPNVTGKYNYLSMSLTDPLPTTSTFTETQCTVGIKHPMSSLTSTTASTAINSYNVTYADHRILSSSNKNNVNSKSSESLLLNPKRFTSMKLNIQDNDNQISCETVTDKIQNHNEKMSRLRETSDEQSVEIVTNNNFSPLHNTNRFNKICRDSSNKQGTLESVHPKFAKSSNQSSNLPDLNNPFVVDLDLKSEIQSHSAVSQNNSALRYRSKSSTGYYSVSRESSNNLFDDYSQHKVKMIPSLQLNSSSKSSQENVPTNRKDEASYRAQVERITNMLAETQNLLQEHSFVKINELLPNVNNNNSNNNNDITTNNSNNNHPVALKA